MPGRGVLLETRYYVVHTFTDGPTRLTPHTLWEIAIWNIRARPLRVLGAHTAQSEPTRAGRCRSRACARGPQGSRTVCHYQRRAGAAMDQGAGTGESLAGAGGACVVPGRASPVVTRQQSQGMRCLLVSGQRLALALRSDSRLAPTLLTRGLSHLTGSEASQHTGHSASRVGAELRASCELAPRARRAKPNEK